MPSSQPTKFEKSRKNLKGSKTTQINCGSMAPSVSSSPTVGKKSKAQKAVKSEKKAKQMKRAFNARTRVTDLTKTPKATKSPNAKTTKAPNGTKSPNAKKTKSPNGTKSPNARKFVVVSKAPSSVGTSVGTNVPVLGLDESTLSTNSSVLKRWRTKARRLLRGF